MSVTPATIEAAVAQVVQRHGLVVAVSDPLEQLERAAETGDGGGVLAEVLVGVADAALLHSGAVCSRPLSELPSLVLDASSGVQARRT
jgi:hypothetical protein